MTVAGDGGSGVELILVLNCGSSSVKFQYIETDLERIDRNQDHRLASGLVEKIFELEVERQRFVKPGPIEPKPIITCYDREYYERNLVNFL